MTTEQIQDKKGRYNEAVHCTAQHVIRQARTVWLKVKSKPNH